MDANTLCCNVAQMHVIITEKKSPGAMTNCDNTLTNQYNKLNPHCLAFKANLIKYQMISSQINVPEIPLLSQRGSSNTMKKFSCFSYSSSSIILTWNV